LNQKSLTNIDWSKIPAPKGEENLNHLNNYIIKPIKLKSTADALVDLSEIKGLTIIYIYPMTGQPDKPLPDNWDNIPGAKRITLILSDNKILKYFYPVFPPDENVNEVIKFLVNK
jgi:hypothetical protein